MKDNKLLFLMLMLVAFFGMASCSETDEDSEEFPNWKNYNDKTFEKLYTTAEAKAQQGDPSWKLIRTWSLSEDYPADKDDHIVVEVLEDGNSDRDCPMYTDSVFMSYSGRLLPSTSFPKGYNFDKTYEGEFNPNTVFPINTGINEFVDGFTTALLHMRQGDYWRVYIPAKLAYGNQIHSMIPQNSMLIFEIYLFDYYHPGQRPSRK